MYTTIIVGPWLLVSVVQDKAFGMKTDSLKGGKSEIWEKLSELDEIDNSQLNREIKDTRIPDWDRSAWWEETSVTVWQSTTNLVVTLGVLLVSFF